jgi:dTDP-4-amino-4,6-dideoxygalactose transaminase
MACLLPIMRPKLPSAASLLPYLQKIDAARVYSNFGPLSLDLERRLGAHFGVAQHAITTAANGTLAITLALLAQDVRPHSLCLMPAWTFVATPQAAVLAGLVPYFVDVDRETGMLNPEAVADAIGRAPGDVGAVVAVGPFGLPLDAGAWDRFRAATGIPVVIDAASGFDTAAATATPTVVSLHATKVLGVGEGSLVLCENADLIVRIRMAQNFGFHGRREAQVPALNAKMSEYHAAVGHAALDEWQRARADWMRVAGRYRHALADSTTARLQNGFGESWVSSVCVLDLNGPDPEYLDQRLATAGIETRRWWGSGAHTHNAMKQWPRTAVPATEALSTSTLGVPMFRDMAPADVDRIVDCLLVAGV